MPPDLHYEAALHPGDGSLHASDAPTGPHSVVFEDDGETGFFYACSAEHEGRILDAVLVYNVTDVSDRHIPSVVQIGWTFDGSMAVLIINKYVHAVIDFPGRRMCCRTGHPPPDGTFASDHTWDENLLNEFKVR